MRHPYPSLRDNRGSKMTGAFRDPADDPTGHPDGRTAGYRPADPVESVRGNRTWWDAEAPAYRVEHAEHLAGRLVWGPEGLDEEQAGLLGEIAERWVVELGAGAADCTSWLRHCGGRAVATALSGGMLRLAPPPVPAGIQCDARRLPFADRTFDIAFSAYG